MMRCMYGHCTIIEKRVISVIGHSGKLHSAAVVVPVVVHQKWGGIWYSNKDDDYLIAFYYDITKFPILFTACR